MGLMKTTIELPDELMIAAKKRAAELRVPLRKLIAEGLLTQLRKPAMRQPVTRKKIRWTTVKGGLPPGLDVADREAMYEWFNRNR